MEGENKSKQIKLSSLLLFLAVLIILAMGGFIAKLLIDKSSADKKTDELNTQVNKLEESVEELKHSLNDSSDTNNSKPVSANDDKSEKSDNKYTQITGELDGIDVLYVTDVVKEGNNYTLKGVIYTQYTMSAKEVQKVSSDGYINIDGRKYTVKDSETVGEYYFFDDTDYPLYALKRQNSSSYYLICQAQLSDVWKLSDKYMEITVPGDTAYSDNFFEETEFTTVSEAFDNYKADAPIETTTPNSSCTFTFKFNNGKCTSVVNTVTSI